MNIWLINHYAVPPEYYPLARPTNFAKYLQRMGHTVKVISASSVHNSKEHLNLITDGKPWRREVVDGIDHVYIRCCDYEGNGLKRIYNMCEFAWKLPGVCKKLPKPDAIVATSIPPMSCAMGIYIARKYGVKGVAEIADLWPESLVAYGIAGPHHPAVLALRRLEKWIYTRADKVVFTCEGGYDYIVEQGWNKIIPRDKVYYINNGIDLETFDYNKEHYQIRDDDLENPNLFKVIYTGSIRKVNNLGLLLDAAKEIKTPKVKLLIWGDGNELLALRQRVCVEMIENVAFKGGVEKKYVPYIVSKADVNIVHNEPSPLFRFGISFNKIFDYLAAEKPILFDFPCMYDSVTQTGAGLSVDDPTPTNIAKIIDNFACMELQERKKMLLAAHHAAEEYDFRRLTEKLVSVIEGV